MRCREALRSIGPYIDGELAAERSEALRSHLESCVRCRRRIASLRGVVREVSSLPPIEPAPAESIRLLNRVRSELERPAAAFPAAARPAVRWAHVTAAAVSILVLVTGAAALAIVEGGGSAVQVEEVAAPEAEGSETIGTFNKKGTNTSDLGGEEFAGTVVDSIPASLARPALVVSAKEYAPGELEDFRGDVATRRKFYSAYWQPQAAGAAAGSTEELRQRLAEDLAAQAQAAGADPEALRSAVDSALAQADGEGLLPCYAELAKVGGREVWLVSLSGPEDFLLFPDAGMPRSMVLASLSGEEGLRVSWSVLKELAAMLAPYHAAYPASEPLTWGFDESGTGTDLSGERGQAQTEEPEPGTDTSAPDASTTQASQEQDVQAFLDEVAARTGNLDALKALERLNYEQVLMLLAGDWAGLAADGVSLSEFLSPPQRLWAVDAATAEVVWSP